MKGYSGVHFTDTHYLPPTPTPFPYHCKTTSSFQLIQQRAKKGKLYVINCHLVVLHRNQLKRTNTNAEENQMAYAAT